MSRTLRSLSGALLALALLALPVGATADLKKATVLDVLAGTDGAQALVAAVLVVDGAEVLPFSIAELLGDRKEDLVVLAPTNEAFEALLGLDPGAQDCLTIAEIQAALPGALPGGVTAADVAAILLKHVVLLDKARFNTASTGALLLAGSIEVADESTLSVTATTSGVNVNDEADVVIPNIPARNGFIHFIDAVIVDDLL